MYVSSQKEFVQGLDEVMEMCAAQDEQFDIFLKNIPEIKVKNVVYVRTLPEIAYKRMLNRQRKEEASVPKSYIQMVHKYHDEWLTNNESDYNICYLDGNKDMDNNNSTMDDHYDKIAVFIKSIN